MTSVKYIPGLVKYLGAPWLLSRLAYLARMKSGWLSTIMRTQDWSEVQLTFGNQYRHLSDPKRYLQYRIQGGPRFFFSPEERGACADLLCTWDRDRYNPVQEAGQISSGWVRLFGGEHRFVGVPPAWHRDPFSGASWPTKLHWAMLDEFSRGDVKGVWELNRFGFAYAFVRAYWRTGDEFYADLFWQLVESWKECNPPNCGINWKCGQEITFRVMAWCFALYGLLLANATTAERVASLANMVFASAVRIEGNIAYALSQANNHSISEALGLFTVGVLFPEFEASERWREKGRSLLEKLVSELVYEDGSFVQHSFNYQRLMLHDVLWAIRLGEQNGIQFSKGLLARIVKSAHLLYQLQEEATGALPVYGNNDGAQILPLNNCPFRDFRPVIQAVHYLQEKTKIYPPGPWDEDLLWLFGPEALSSPTESVPRGDLIAPEGGYYVLRSDGGYAFTRCCTYRHRPSQADLLHVDIRWHGHEVAVDPGTYSYNTIGAWDHALSRTAFHNTVTVDRLDQMDLAGRFLWLPWLRGKVRPPLRSPKGFIACFEGSHDGYQRLPVPVLHSRALIQLGSEHWIVLDRLRSNGSHLYSLHWLLADHGFRDEGKGRFTCFMQGAKYVVECGCRRDAGLYKITIADPRSPKGWRCPTYRQMEPAYSISLETRSKNSVFFSAFGPQLSMLAVSDDRLQLALPDATATIVLTPDLQTGIVSRVVVDGMWTDSLKIC